MLCGWSKYMKSEEYILYQFSTTLSNMMENILTEAVKPVQLKKSLSV